MAIDMSDLAIPVGGVTGAGATVGVREFFDLNADGTPRHLIGTPGSVVGRVGRPSALYGLGTGTLATAGWWMTDRGMAHDFLLAHGLTGLAAGLAMVAMPKEGTASTAAAGAGAGAGRSGSSRGAMPPSEDRGGGNSRSESLPSLGELGSL